MPVRVCIAGPLTGPRACYGDLIREAISDSPQREGLSIHFFDDKANPQVVKLHLAEIIKKSDVVIGHFNSDCAQAAIPAYRMAGIPLLLPASTAAHLGEGESVFQLCSTEAEQVKEMIAVADSQYPDSMRYYWADGSAYSHRLLKWLQAHHGYPIPEIGTSSKGGHGAGGVTFYLGAHFSILARMHQEGALWLGAAICCDDCDITEFTQRARPETWVCSSTPGYSELLQRAVDIVWRVMYRKSNNWADYFDERGMYLPTSWQSYCIK
ncbi:hypothetical protein [Erwinia pyrifoliae]|uniref:Leucine-binding protein domain-containing protein n=1 Tax=Erwinia pyrifoliae TaxID=79967 RepID=A0ABY5X9F2_ERWPY|nr:hypothetical protein [Erwinia pyrifoliae]AUX73997.1 hypothetical protein CPI84_16950 [Erwinia pyrifoliae]MCA8875663.1 hypothetical protein [Erwinia pyrifoliae]MCT2385868.1 hypothetical protein [Erwinia pyrifoliae]MCU8588555.1 hypothetical protein [Erwinia pyrifoliae]UWS29706.1 hypothetical protein NYP81_17940 [Erwinia pyrifoliae]